MQGFLNAVTGIANESGFVGIMENPGYLETQAEHQASAGWN